MNDVVLEARNLSKRYNHKTLFEGINLTAFRGQSIAFIGCNGTGKTTFLKILAKLVTPSQGTVIFGKDIRFGYVPEHFPKTSLTPAQYIRYMALIEGLDQKTAIRRGQSLFEDFFLEDMTDVPIKHLSKGTIQKVGAIQALLADNHVLLLDEPLSGQDSKSQKVFAQKIEERKRAGTTVLLSCHEMPLVSRLADIIYEIKDRTLCKIALEDCAVQAYTTLVFTMPEDWYQQLPPSALRVRKEKGKLSMDVPGSLCDEVIIEMIQKGLSLKEIWHENNF